MAKNNKRRRSRNITISAAMTAGIVAYGAQVAHSRQEGIYGMTRAAVLYGTGFDMYSNRFYFQFLNRGLFPVLGGMALHFLANRLGVNRMIARAGIPLVRI